MKKDAKKNITPNGAKVNIPRAPYQKFFRITFASCGIALFALLFGSLGKTPDNAAQALKNRGAYDKIRKSIVKSEESAL